MDIANIYRLLFLLLGSILGYWLRVGTDAAKSRRAFRNFIASLDDEFAAEWRKVAMMDGDEFQKWERLTSHFASVPRVKAEATKVREDIFWWHRRRFKAA